MCVTYDHWKLNAGAQLPVLWMRGEVMLSQITRLNRNHHTRLNITHIKQIAYLSRGITENVPTCNVQGFHHADCW